ncbi:MAG: YegP family protein [Chloroflexi bacterium]|nr:YegP family protein [Chloroflexota bacterium]
MAGKFVLKKNTKDQYYFNLLAGNNQVILSSETYASKENALNGIESVKKNAGKDTNFEKKLSTKGDPFFVLKAPNGQIIGKSEMYSSETAMDKGIASVKSNAPDATVVEEAS